MGYSYDKLGQRTGEQVTGPDGKASATSFTYTADGQVQGIVQVGLSVSSRYDALGRAASTSTKTAAGTGGSQSAGGAGKDGAVGEWGLSDRLSSTIATAAVSSGQVDQDATYSDFGVAKYATTGWDAQAGFSGEVSDATTGLNAYYARTLDVTVGQFTSPDPWPGSMTDPQSQASHAYVHNNPATYRDWAGFAMNAGDWGVSRGSWRPTPPAVSHYNPQPRGTGVSRPDTMTYRGSGGNTCSPTSGCISRYFATGRQQTAVNYRNGRVVTPTGQPRLDTSSYNARTPADASAPNYRPEPCYSPPGVPFCSNSQIAGATTKQFKSSAIKLARYLYFIINSWSGIVRELGKSPWAQGTRRTVRILGSAPYTLVGGFIAGVSLLGNRIGGNKKASCGFDWNHFMVVCSGFKPGTGFGRGGTTYGSVFITEWTKDTWRRDWNALLDHEEIHGDQYAWGQMAFVSECLVEAAVVGECSTAERMAGFANGGHMQCR